MINNLNEVYNLIKLRQENVNSFYDLLEGKEDADKQKLLDEILKVCGFEKTKENCLAVINRIANPRGDSLSISLENEGYSKKEINAINLKAYELVKSYHLIIQKDTIEQIEKKGLLSKFYLTLLKGVYEVGTILSDIQPLWTKLVVQEANEDLSEQHGDGVYEFLSQNRLYEYLEDGVQADRAYSVLIKKDGEYKSYPYMQAFEDMSKVVERLDKLSRDLRELEDEEFGQKNAYIRYFDALKVAFGQEDKSQLLNSWRKVDVAWMGVTCPLQVAHPLEYYEDHLRKAVALEWDVRLDDVKRAKETSVKNDILSMYESLTAKITDDRKVYEKCVANVNRVGLHVGRPAFYFAAEFDGQFSAQVVPNDEVVSKAYGKKIFAFADNIYENAKAKPFLKIQKDIFGDEFLKQEREILFRNKALWHKVYEVSTIGHEFGHILWLDEDNEVSMNKSGMFKNIEEFKATTGGLVAFFYNEKDDLKRPLMIDLIKRSIGLIAWMKTGEVEPYYCEGLIHLQGLFESKVLSFKDKLHIDMSLDAYERMKAWYLQTYEDLALYYLSKADAKDFLNKYAKKEDGFFMPVDGKVKYFVKYYWNLHQSIGRVVDESESKNDYL